ncbi:MAG: sugar phosphate isomerase/epimerase [Planctomycetes bacterium]|nr:sugar phosphate isomerase/epimerase [Planctomycetota bacterium]
MKYGVVYGRLKDETKDPYQLAAEYGFDGLELVFGANEYEQNPLWTPEGVEEIKSQTVAAGIAVPSVCGGYYNQRGLAADDAELRRTGVEVLLTLIDRCADVGMETILLAFFGKGEITEPQHEDYVVEAMEQCAPKAQARNINLCLETTLPAKRFLALAQRINHPHVRIYYDLANPVMWDENPAEGLDILSEFVAQIHVKDRGENDGNVQLGTGRVPYPDVVKTIRKIGYDGWMCLETPAGNDETAANLKFIKDQIGE